MMPNAALMPPRFKDSLDLYVEKRLQPGGFLAAVLCNDLKESVSRADEEALACIPHIVAYLYNDVRADCWGSPEKYRAWLAGRHA